MARVPTSINLDKAASFNGTSSEITFTAPTSFDPATLTAFTIAVWLYPTTIDSTVRGIFNGVTGATQGWRMTLDSTNGLTFLVAHSTDAKFTSGAGVIPLNTWTRVMVTWDDADTVPKFYKNATLTTPATTQSKSGTRGTVSTKTMRLGASNAVFYEGYMDEVCLWNRVLTGTEMTDDYEELVNATSGQLLRYSMNEPTGNFSDSSGSNLTGTAANMQYGASSYYIPVNRTTADARTAAGTRTLAS